MAQSKFVSLICERKKIQGVQILSFESLLNGLEEASVKPEEVNCGDFSKKWILRYH